MSIAAVSSSSKLLSSSSDIKEDLVGEAMFLLLCVWGMFGGLFWGESFLGEFMEPSTTVGNTFTPLLPTYLP